MGIMISDGVRYGAVTQKEIRPGVYMTTWEPITAEATQDTRAAEWMKRAGLKPAGAVILPHYQQVTWLGDEDVGFGPRDDGASPPVRIPQIGERIICGDGTPMKWDGARWQKDLPTRPDAVIRLPTADSDPRLGCARWAP